MHAIGEQDGDNFRIGVDPQACSGKAKVSDAVWPEGVTCTRSFGALPVEPRAQRPPRACTDQPRNIDPFPERLRHLIQCVEDRASKGEYGAGCPKKPRVSR